MQMLAAKQKDEQILDLVEGKHEFSYEKWRGQIMVKYTFLLLGRAMDVRARSWG